MRAFILFSALGLIALLTLATPPPPGGIGGTKRVPSNWISDPVIPFSPSDVDGLQFWFKGDTFNQTEGASISNWLNSASQVDWYVTNQTSAQWPQLTNNFNGTGKKALRFGASQFLWVSNSLALNVTRNTNDCAIISVVRVNNTATSKVIFHIATSTAGSVREQVLMDTTEAINTTRRNLDSDSNVLLASATAQPTTISLCVYSEFVHTNKVAVSGSVMTIFTNNVQDATSTAGSNTNTSDTASGAIVLGANGGGGLAFSGEMAEILVYVPLPSASNRTNIYNYLKAKYALLP